VPIAPFVVVAPYAWTESRRQGRGYVLVVMMTLAAVCCLASMLAISTIYIEIGRLAVGIEWGQRYMLTLYAVAAALTVIAVQLYWRSARPLWLRRLFVGVVGLMVLIAVAFEIRGNAMLYATRVRLTAWEEAMQQEGPIVTDVWWLPASFAILYTEHEMYYVYGRADVARWIDIAAPRGIRGFTFVGFEPVDAREFETQNVRLASRQPKNVDGLILTRFTLGAAPVQVAD
jgi:hypothetical protein